MPSLTIPASGLAFEVPAGPPKSKAAQNDIFGLTLTDDMIESLIKCVRSGQGLQLALGPEPTINFGSESLYLEPSSDTFSTEIFRNDQQSGTMVMYNGPFGNTKKTWDAKPKPVQSRIRGGRTTLVSTTQPAVTGSAPKFPDEALAQLSKSINQAEAHKSANTTQKIKTSAAPATNGKRGVQKPSTQNRFLASQPMSNGTTRSMPSSPALNASGSPALVPTHVPLSQQQAEKTKAIRNPLIHRLALGPSTESDLLKYKELGTDAEYKTAIEKVADLKDGKWVLTNRMYRELDVYRHNYCNEGERQKVIENAVKAYDKLRLNASEPEWDRLLPKEERGTGKCLSKLQAAIAGGEIKSAKTPKISVNKADDSGRNTPKGDDAMLGDKASAGGDNTSRSHSQPPTSKPKKASEKEAQAKRLLARPGKATKAAVPKPKPAPKASAETSSKIKSSKFVSDSDEDDDVPIIVSRNLPAQTKKAITPKPLPTPPKPAQKRGREEADISDAGSTVKKPKVAGKSSISSTNSSTPSKHRISDASQSSRTTTSSHLSNGSTGAALPKSTTSPQKSSPLASSPPTNATDVEESYTTSSSSSPFTHANKRKLDSTLKSSAPAPKRHQKSTSSISTQSGYSTSSSSRFVGWDGIPSTQIVELAAKFKTYYAKYKELWERLDRDMGRTTKDMAELNDMHDRLARMKKEIKDGSKGIDGENIGQWN